MRLASSKSNLYFPLMIVSLDYFSVAATIYETYIGVFFLISLTCCKIKNISWPISQLQSWPILHFFLDQISLAHKIKIWYGLSLPPPQNHGSKGRIVQSYINPCTRFMTYDVRLQVGFMKLNFHMEIGIKSACCTTGCSFFLFGLGAQGSNLLWYQLIWIEPNKGKSGKKMINYKL
jgi:hypothetical protein